MDELPEAESISDEALLAQYLAGSLDAFECLHARYRGPLYAYLFHFLRDSHLAEDVYQEVFLRVVRGAGNFDSRQRFAAWLFRIARNGCIDAVRRASYRKTVSLDSPVLPGVSGTDGDGTGTLAERIRANEPSPSEVASRRELHDQVLAALEELPDTMREVVLLKEAAGLTFQEIAQVTGEPQSTLKSRARAAIQKIAARVNASDVDVE